MTAGFHNIHSKTEGLLAYRQGWPASVGILAYRHATRKRVLQHQNSQSQSHPLGFDLGGAALNVGFPVGRKAR